jgi:cytochrome c553
MKKTSVLLSVVVLFASLSSFAELTQSGFDTYKCTKCHEMTANPYGYEFPRLAGQTTEYFINSMKSYKAGKHHNFPAERYMTQRLNYYNFSDATISQLADFFNKMTPKQPMAIDSQKVTMGKDIFENGIPVKNVFACAACHGAAGEGNGLNPRLAGQFKSFANSQLHMYKAGKIDGEETMKEIVKEMTDAEMDAVSTYLETL